MNVEHRRVAMRPQELAELLLLRAREGDIDGIVELYEADAVLALEAGRLARGSDQIRQFFTDFLAAGGRIDPGQQRSPIVSGDLALTSTRLPDGESSVEVARRQADGSWRWVIDQPTLL